MVESRCGILCSRCDYRAPMACGGCVAIQKPFWAQEGPGCPVKNCCEGKGHAHCGECDAFPCQLLNSFAHDPDQGDDGLRIEQCRAWRGG